MAGKDRKQPVILLPMKDCVVSRNEVTWVNHIISIHRVRCKFMVLKSSLNANTGAGVSTLLKNRMLAISACTEIVSVESSYIFKTDLLVTEF